MIIFLYGDDSYRLLERLQFLQEAFRAKYDEKSLNMVELTGESFDIDNFHKHTRSVGLFSQKRFVSFRNLWKLSKDQQDQLSEDIKNIDDDTVLCIVAEQPPRKNNKLFKQLLKANTVEEYAELNPQQLRTFIRQKVKDFEAEIDPSAIEHLAASIGNDLWRQTLEIKKISNFTKKINSSIVAEFVDKAMDDNIFHLTDALGARNCSRATELLQQQYELGANPQYLITMIAKHVANLLKVKKTGGKGLQMHPYVKEKSLKQAEHFSETDLQQLYWKMLEIDEQLKTTPTDPRALLDLFIIQACTISK